MKKLVVFDLDGTLVNSLEDLADAVNLGLKSMGFPVHEVEKFRYFVGNGAMLLCQRALPEKHRTDENTTALYKKFAQHYAVHFADKTRPYDGIAELLRDIKSKGINIAVASNKPHADCNRVVDMLFDRSHIDAAMGSNNGFEKKPAPDIVFELMQRFGADASQTLFVGDSDVDIITAKNASVESVGCLWGFRTEDELKNAGADFIAASPCDILKYI